MKSNPTPSAPLNLCPPAGVTGTTLDDLPDRRTVWEMRVDGYFLRWCGTLEQFRKDCEEYCDRSKGYWEKVTNTEFRFISPEEPKITHFKAVKKGVDSIAESSATLPASPEGVACVPAESFLGILIAPDGTRHFSCYDAPGMTQERSEAMEYANKEAAEKACLYRLGKGEAYWGSERSARESMAKGMAGWTYSVETANDAPHKPVCPVHNFPLEFHGYIPTPPDSSTPEEDWRCVECDSPSPSEPVKALPDSPVKDTPDFSGLAPIFDKAELASRKTAAAPALPVASVGVPELQVFPPVNEYDAARIHFAKGDRALVCKIGRNRRSAAESLVLAESIVSACASHAAKDAKIKALESAVEGLLNDSNLAAYITELEAKPLDEVDEYDARTIQSVESARAALALPCAPQES